MIYGGIYDDDNEVSGIGTPKLIGVNGKRDDSGTIQWLNGANEPIPSDTTETYSIPESGTKKKKQKINQNEKG